MKLEFKKPSDETLKVKSQIASGKIDFDSSITEDKIKNITNHSYCNLTNSGNSSILLSLSAIDEKIIIPDQGGWNGFKQYAKFLNKEIEILKTDEGIISTDLLNELDLNKCSGLILTSFAAYSGEQNIKAISKYCHEHNIILIEDASGGICDNEKKLGNGKYSDIIIASTGSPKMINVESGGFISYNNEKFKEIFKIPLKALKCDNITAGGINTELNYTSNNFKKTVEACKYLKNNLDNVIHQNKRGINVIIKCEDPKKTSYNLRNELPIDKKSFFTKCPNYNRVKEKAVAIEIKNLNTSSLTKENLDEIIEKVKIYQ
ncbi:DegT/DnrJ/EryC1/StrS family aminotransferase [Methanobrevibacter sp. DSM 116169]|uniref:DegT/DnrJ/EryC1/StrS family aminotransferase n=1 Tax=Methanobrevibacter sp. DSM 116169 TaxID=3242727 RepID=UPI0038FC18B1